MRVVALIFGLLGAAGSGVLGVKWTSDIQKQKADMEIMRKVIEIAGDPAAKEVLAKYDRTTYAAYALLGGAALGAVGCLLVLNRKGLIAALLFLIGFATPLALVQDGKPAVFTFGLVLAGLFSIFVKSGTPYKAPKPGEGISEDDDMV